MKFSEKWNYYSPVGTVEEPKYLLSRGGEGLSTRWDLKTPLETKDFTDPGGWGMSLIAQPEYALVSVILFLYFSVHLSDPHVIPKAVDSHPRRMNGYLTGCFLQV